MTILLLEKTDKINTKWLILTKAGWSVYVHTGNVTHNQVFSQYSNLPSSEALLWFPLHCPECKRWFATWHNTTVNNAGCLFR